MNISLLERFSSKLDPTVRQRGAKILAAKQFSILESDNLSCLAKVSSDSVPGQEYSVRIMEANNLLTASCTCQFYQENGFCKHISAIVSHLIIQKATHGMSYSGHSAVTFLPSDVTLPYVGITKEFVRAYSSAQYISLAQKALDKNVGRPVTVKEKWEGHVLCEVADGETYWRHLMVGIDLQGDQLRTSCTCGQNKAALCSHKVTVLHYLSHGYAHPEVLSSFPAKEKLVKEALRPYGFSPEDPNIDRLFRMETDANGNYVAIPLQKGIVKTISSGNSLKSAMHFHEALSLPVEEVATDKEKKSEFGYAYLICPTEHRHGLGHLPMIYTLCGSFNKDRTELVRNIFHKGEAYEKGHVLPVPSSNQHAIEEILAQLQEKVIAKYAKRQGEELQSNQAVAHYVCDHLAKLLPLLKEEIVYFSDSEYFSKSSLDRITISDKSPELRFRLYHEPPFLCLNGLVFLKDKPVSKLREEEYFYYFFVKDAQLLSFESAVDVLHGYQFLHQPEIKVHASDEGGFLQEVGLPLSKKYKMDFELSKPVRKGEASSFRVAVYLNEQGNFLLIRPVAEYEQGTVDLFSEELLLKQEEGGYFQYDRNEEAEKTLRELLVAMHPDFPKQSHRGFFYVHFDKLLEEGWYFQFFQQLKEAEITVFGLEKIKKARYSPHRPSIKTRIGSGIDWFDVSIEISFGEQSVSLKEVQKALLRKENYVVLNDGTKGLLPQEWLEKHAALIRSGTVDKKGTLKLSKLHFNLLDELLEEVDQEEILREIFEKKQKLLSFEGIRQHEIPKTITAELRHYQESGFDWLMFLDEFGWGGCLADDMGLGKTLQVITFLKRQTELYPDKPNLIVLPTSLLFNWKNELRKFAPDLTYLDYTGPQRNKQRTNFSHYHLVLTTYGLIVNDIEKLHKVSFNYVVLDESQAVKNPESQRYKAVCLLQARNKLVMTGTPIENNTFDLFAQMNFVNPGLLGSMGHFQSHFSTPIDKFGDQEAATSLRKIISPFLLRRTKEQVAPELPDKTEDVLFCEMGAEQRKVYNAFRDNYRQMIVGKIEQEGLGKSSMMVLDALLKLRQICNSPALLNTDEQYGSDSIKLQELLEHLTEKTGQHKVLVFSQFTQMLKLVEAELTKAGLAHEYLDGQTPAAQREAKVARFQSDPSVRIFLISLKAGGVGLNLTEADYVYLIDPWWNPAVEAQAIDRTHRIGQNKKVFAYRMICKDTIEEKVLQLQERKRKVAEDLISTEAAFFKQLDKEDIVELFS